MALGPSDYGVYCFRVSRRNWRALVTMASPVRVSVLAATGARDGAAPGRRIDQNAKTRQTRRVPVVSYFRKVVNRGVMAVTLWTNFMP